MWWITLILLGVYTCCCYGNGFPDHAMATLNHRQTSTAFQLDGSNRTPLFHKNSCSCNTEVHVMTDQNQGRGSIPINMCRCQECVAYDSDGFGNPNYQCQESIVNLDELNNIPNQQMRAMAGNFPQVHQPFPMFPNANQIPNLPRGNQPFQQQPFNFNPYQQQPNLQYPPRHQSQQHNIPQHPIHHSRRQRRAAFDWEQFFNKVSLMGSHDSTYNKRTQGYFHYNFNRPNTSTTNNGATAESSSTVTAAPETATTP